MIDGGRTDILAGACLDASSVFGRSDGRRSILRQEWQRPTHRLYGKDVVVGGLGRTPSQGGDQTVCMARRLLPTPMVLSRCWFGGGFGAETGRPDQYYRLGSRHYLLRRQNDSVWLVGHTPSNATSAKWSAMRPATGHTIHLCYRSKLGEAAMTWC